jgi:hypothetical protein
MTEIVDRFFDASPDQIEALLLWVIAGLGIFSLLMAAYFFGRRSAEKDLFDGLSDPNMVRYKTVKRHGFDYEIRMQLHRYEYDRQEAAKALLATREKHKTTQ